MNKNIFMQVCEISKMSMNLFLKVGNFSSSYFPKLFQNEIFTSIVFFPTGLFCAKTNLENRKKTSQTKSKLTNLLILTL